MSSLLYLFFVQNESKQSKGASKQASQASKLHKIIVQFNTICGLFDREITNERDSASSSLIEKLQKMQLLFIIQ